MGPEDRPQPFTHVYLVTADGEHEIAVARTLIPQGASPWIEIYRSWAPTRRRRRIMHTAYHRKIAHRNRRTR